MVQSQLQKMKDVYHEYPRVFWNLVVITFIDRIGGALIFPFFALYLTSKFGVGMTDLGFLSLHRMRRLKAENVAPLPESA